MSARELPAQITIDLSNADDAYAFTNKSEIIQQDAMEAFFDHVKDSLRKAERYRDVLERDKLEPRKRYHDSIMIYGSRGSGKTSFMLSMFEMLKDCANDNQYSKDIYVLGILDPTLIEEKEHIFIHILSLIKEHVDRHYHPAPTYGNVYQQKKCPCRYEQGECNTVTISDECYREWLGMLNLLAAGLPSLDGVGENDFLKSEKWHDPTYVLETGLRNTASSFCLEINFHKFIDKSLRLLGKKAFAIGFDDIDTHFKRGWPLLEIIRKYLTTPQLITIVSGDDELYSMLVRSWGWDNFSERILKQESDKKFNIFRPMIDRLEDQYMAKVFKPVRRLQLQTLNNLFEENIHVSGKTKILIKHWSENNESDLKKILEEIVCSVFMVKDADKSLYMHHLLREPLRNVLRLLTSYFETKSVKRSKDELVDALIESFIHMYHVQLMRFGFNLPALRDPDPRITFNQLMHDLSHQGLFKRGYRLKADFQDQDHNRLMLPLAAKYNSLLRIYPALFFDYFIKVGLTREIGLIELNSDKEQYISYMQWVGLSDGETSVAVARSFNGYIRFITEQTSHTSVVGTVLLNRAEQKKSTSVFNFNKSNPLLRLYGYSPVVGKPGSDPRRDLLEKIPKGHPLYPFLSHTTQNTLRLVTQDGNTSDLKNDQKAYFYNTLEELEERISSWHRFLINLPANRVINSRNETSVVWSIHGLLAVICELLACDTADEIHSIIVRSSQLRDYPMPESGQTNAVQETTLEDDSDSELITDDSSSLEKFIGSIIAWKKNCKDYLPVHIVARIFTRFYYSLGRLDNDLPISQKLLGKLIHRYIIIFLNSILVEESLYRGGHDSIRLLNPISSDRYFDSNMNNIKKIAEGDSKEPRFWKWMLECPFWQYLLDPRSELFKYGVDHLKWQERVEANYLGIEIPLFDLMNSVLIRDYGSTVTKSVSGENTPQKLDSLPPYNKKVLIKILETQSSLVLSELTQYFSRPVEMTKRFIELFLEDKYKFIPKAVDGEPFKKLHSELHTFMQRNSQGK